MIFSSDYFNQLISMMKRNYTFTPSLQCRYLHFRDVIDEYYSIICRRFITRALTGVIFIASMFTRVYTRHVCFLHRSPANAFVIFDVPSFFLVTSRTISRKPSATQVGNMYRQPNRFDSRWCINCVNKTRLKHFFFTLRRQGIGYIVSLRNASWKMIKLFVKKSIGLPYSINIVFCLHTYQYEISF